MTARESQGRSENETALVSAVVSWPLARSILGQ
jgi:hypothetical protein